MASVMRFDQWQDSNGVPIFNASGGVAPSGFTASTTITASNSSWPVPALKSPIVKVTVIGGGGGATDGATSGSAGGTTTFNAGGAGTVSATGGIGAATGNAVNGPDGTRSSNGAPASNVTGNQNFNAGQGGQIVVAYFNLTGVSTVNVTVGAGGARGGSSTAAGNGGRGEVIVEYVAA